jgi:hypothetical protein
MHNFAIHLNFAVYLEVYNFQLRTATDQMPSCSSDLEDSLRKSENKSCERTRLGLTRVNQTFPLDVTRLPIL